MNCNFNHRVMGYCNALLTLCMYVKWERKHLNTCNLAWSRIKSTFLQTEEFVCSRTAGLVAVYTDSFKNKGAGFCMWIFGEELQSWETDLTGIFFYLERVQLTFLHSWSCEFKLDLVDCQVVKLCCVVAYITELSLWTITWSLGRSTNFSKAIAEQLNSFIFTMHVLRITAKRICFPKNTHEVCCKRDCFLQIRATVNS